MKGKTRFGCSDHYPTETVYYNSVKVINNSCIWAEYGSSQVQNSTNQMGSLPQYNIPTLLTNVLLKYTRFREIVVTKLCCAIFRHKFNREFAIKVYEVSLSSVNWFPFLPMSFFSNNSVIRWTAYTWIYQDWTPTSTVSSPAIIINFAPEGG